MGRINLVRPDGSVASVDEASAPALRRIGYRDEQHEEGVERAAEAQTEAYYDTPGQKAIAFTEGAAEGVTLGIAELLLDDESSREREKYLPGWKTGGEIFGAVAPVLVSGGSSAGASAARLTPTALASRAGERVASRVAKGAVGKAAVSAGVEGGISAAGLTAAKVLTDQSPDSIESFVSDVGLGTLFGVGAGAALGGGIGAIGQVGRSAQRRIADRAARAESVPAWKTAEADSLRSNLDLHIDDAAKSIEREISTLTAEIEPHVVKIDAEEALHYGQIPAYPDLIQQALDEKAMRKAAGASAEELAAIDRRIVRLGNEMDAGGGPRAGGRPKPEPQGPGPEAKTGAGKNLARGTPEQATGAGKGPKQPAPRSPTQGTRPLQAVEELEIKGVADDLRKADPSAREVDYEGYTAASQQAAKMETEMEALSWRLKGLEEVRQSLKPQALAKLSPSDLVETLEKAKTTLRSTPAYAGVRQAYEGFLDEMGVNAQLAGLTPADLAEAAGVPPKLWSTLEQDDLPALAVWAHLRAPRNAAGKAIPIPGVSPGGGGEKGKAGALTRLTGKALRYLGGRAAKAATGGGFGAYMLGWQAVDAAWSGKLGGLMRGAKAATAARVDKSLAKLAGMEKGARPAGKAAGPVASLLAGGGREGYTPKEYEEATREVHAMAGAQGREALYAATMNLRLVDPELADKVVEQAMSRMRYLAGVLPKPPPQGLFPNPRWAPSPVDQAKTQGVVQVVLDPPSAVEAMAAGRLTPQMAQAFRETAPALFEKVAQSLMDFASQNPDASPFVKRQVSMMLGVPADSLQLYTAQLQAHFGESAPEPGPALSAKAPPSTPTQAQVLTER